MSVVIKSETYFQVLVVEMLVTGATE